ncbi:MAG: DUF362 domain-containing protein [Gemmatimonadota bacterium]|nr:DUF362 domain-containing protein [Gemmatimonadota bacterium]
MKKLFHSPQKNILFIVVFALVAADFLLWSQTAPDHTRWRALKDFSYDPAKESTVSIVRSENTSLSEPVPVTETLDYDQVARMVELAVELAGGLESYIGPDDRKIVLKPNIVEPTPNGNGVNTDWRVVKALALLLYRINPEYEIIVAEAAGGWARPGTPHVRSWALKDGYSISGYQEMIESLQGDPDYPDLKLEWVDMNYDETVEVQVPLPRINDVQTSFFLPRTLVDADFIIDVPVLKVHGTCITVGLKNYVGALPGLVYGWSKDGGYNNNGLGLDHTPETLQENFVEIARTAGCDFVVVDCIMGKEKTKYSSGISKRRNMIAAGEDVVSVDAVCAHLMDFNPDDVEHVSIAALSGLGQNDLEKITVVGSTIEEAKTRFWKAEKHQTDLLKNSIYPYYGQSNRVWLLSGPYFGDNVMETDFLDTEAEAAPEAGLEGWSEPVYFFDDLIDPAGVFQDSADCVYYAFSYIEALEDSPAQMWLGSRGDLDVWLNGEKVYSYDGGSRRHRLPNDVTEVNISAGTNRLLVKGALRYGVCEFSLNICELESDSKYMGNRLAGLEFTCSLEPDALKGDYNGDGELNIIDAISLLTGIHGNPAPDEACDFNGDGMVNVVDVIALILYMRGE